jgi:oligoendopeptidase F
MKFGVITDEKGVERELTQSSYSSFMVKRDPELRKRAWHQFYAEFDDHKFTVASTLSSSVKSDVFRARARNYPSAREAALFYDDVPVSVYDNLIASVRANLAPLFRYLELRRRVLGLKEVHAYDTSVPMVANIETDTSWDEACDKVLAAFAPLGREYVETLGEGLRGRWCDRYENKGKRSGAFSSSSYGNPPFILMNYKRDVFADVYTLAHEAGHSMHTWYAQKTQPFQTYDYPIFLAEVASTFNEELLTHHLLEQTTSAARSSGRRCLRSLKSSRMRWRKQASRLRWIVSATCTADCSTRTLVRTLSSMRSSNSSACASRTFTLPSTSTNTPPA